MLRLLAPITLAILLNGCASPGLVQNAPRSEESSREGYSIRAFQKKWETDENALMLAFSGGGTRAAALAYGVLKELRDTRVPVADGSGRLLDQTHSIMSVSGGSFTAAYYGLYGDGIFDDFEDRFLRRDVEGALIQRLLNPVQWLSSIGRTDRAVSYYQSTVFGDATFADLQAKGGPMIVVNASDLGYGVRFSFTQEYFDLLCSDLSSFPVARAVAASSAVPVLFNPVVIRNYSDCGSELPYLLTEARRRAAANSEIAMVVDGLETYFDREKRKYAHFVDGGLTDNLGLRAIYEVVELAGGMSSFTKAYHRNPPRRLAVISVNASTDPEPKMDQTNEQPSLEETIDAMSDIQLHRYNAATIELMRLALGRWAADLSTPERPVEPYFILVDFDGIQEPRRRRFLNRIPTSFALDDEQVDGLIDAGGELLRNNPEFQRLLADLESDRAASR